MAHSAIRIASVAYDAAARHYDAALEFFTPGLKTPLHVGVILSGPQNLDHLHLTRGLVAQASRQICRQV